MEQGVNFFPVDDTKNCNEHIKGESALSKLESKTIQYVRGVRKKNIYRPEDRPDRHKLLNVGHESRACMVSKDRYW